MTKKTSLRQVLLEEGLTQNEDSLEWDGLGLHGIAWHVKGFGELAVVDGRSFSDPDELRAYIKDHKQRMEKEG